MCQLPPDRAFEITALAALGTSWRDLAREENCSHESIRRHIELHCDPVVLRLRLWVQQTGRAAAGKREVQRFGAEGAGEELSPELLLQRLDDTQWLIVAAIKDLQTAGDSRGVVAAAKVLSDVLSSLLAATERLNPAPVVVPGFDNPYRGDLLADVEKLIDKKVEAAYLAGMAGGPMPARISK